jgi:hypothetical protein
MGTRARSTPPICKYSAVQATSKQTVTVYSRIAAGDRYDGAGCTTLPFTTPLDHLQPPPFVAAFLRVDHSSIFRAWRKSTSKPTAVTITGPMGRSVQMISRMTVRLVTGISRIL